MKFFKKPTPPIIIALDIDGVLLPSHPQQPNYDIQSIYGAGALSEQCINYVNILNTFAPVYWFTTWTDDANEYFSDWLGMRLPVIPLNFEQELSAAQDKTKSLLQWSEQHKNTHIYVLDDEVLIDNAHITSLEIDPLSGLQEHHVDMVQEFIKPESTLL